MTVNIGSDFHENKKHGNALRPFATYRNVFTPSYPGFPKHWHGEVELKRVQAGSGEVEIGNESFTAHAGDIIIANAKELHEIKLVGDELVTDSILFDLHILESAVTDACTVLYLAPIFSGKHFFPHHIEAGDPEFKVFDENMTTIFYAAYDKPVGWEMAVKANLYWFIFHMYRLGLMKTDPNVSDAGETVVMPALELIKENYSEELSVEKLAEACGYSEPYFMKLFKKATGRTPIDYINSVRLSQAAHMLLSSADDITDIAVGVGFNNVSYFDRQFKRLYGFSPKDYRASCKRESGFRPGV